MKLTYLIFLTQFLSSSTPIARAHPLAHLPKRDPSGALLPDGGVLIFYNTDEPSASSQSQQFTRTGVFDVTIDVRSAVFRMKYPKCTVDYPSTYDPKPGDPPANILNSATTLYQLRWIKQVEISCSTIKSGPLDGVAKGREKE